MKCILLYSNEFKALTPKHTTYPHKFNSNMTQYTDQSICSWKNEMTPPQEAAGACQYVLPGTDWLDSLMTQIHHSHINFQYHSLQKVYSKFRVSTGQHKRMNNFIDVWFPPLFYILSICCFTMLLQGPNRCCDVRFYFFRTLLTFA